MLKIKKRFVNQSLFTQFFVFYICIFLVPVLISGMIYIRSLGIIKKEINNSNIAMLKQMQISIDSRLEDMERLTSSLNYDQAVSSLLYKQQLIFQDYLTMRNVIDKLQNLNVNNTFIDELYIYFKNTNMVLTPSCSYEKSFVAPFTRDSILQDDSWRGREIKLLFSGGGENSETMSVDSSIVLYRSLPFDNSNRSNAVVVIYLNKSEIKKILSGNSWLNNGMFFIIDQNNNLLFSNAGIQYRADEFTDIISYGDVRYEIVDGQKMAISQVASEKSMLRFVSVMPCSIYNMKVNSLRNLYIISLSFCILCGGLLALYFTKRNYNPIKYIVRKILKTPDNRISNEYSIISNFLMVIMSENEESNKKMLKQKFAMRDSFISGIVKGNEIDDAYIPDGLVYFDIGFESEYFAVMLFYFDDCGALNSKDEMQNAEFKLKKKIIMDCAVELLNKESLCYLTGTEEGIAGLINLQNDDDSWIEYLKDSANIIMEAFRKKSDDRISIAISSMHKSISQISSAYREAANAMEYRILTGSGSIICFRDIRMSYDNNIGIGHSAFERERLVNSLKAGDIKNARLLLEGIINREFFKGQVPVSLARCRMLGLIDTVISTIEDLPLEDYGISIIEKEGIVERMLGCSTVVDLKLEMEKILDQIELRTETVKNERNERLKNEILEYIDKNCTCCTLNVSALARYFSISTDSISRFFKKCMNTGLLYYINELRIEKSMMLLEQSDMPVKLIAEKTGFTSCDTYIRVFKKIKGIAPGKYRETFTDKTRGNTYPNNL